MYWVVEAAVIVENSEVGLHPMSQKAAENGSKFAVHLSNTLFN